MTEIDLTEAEASRKRRADGLARDRGTDLLKLCLRLRLLGDALLLLRHGLIVFRAGDRALVHKTLHAFKIETRKLASGLNCG